MTTQETRLLQIDSPLGPDALHLRSFVGEEALSRAFEYRLEVVAAEDHIAPEDLLGKPVHFWIEASGVRLGEHHGHVAQLTAGPLAGGRQRVYHALVVPWLWFLGKRQASRIFQGKTAVEIITGLFDELGFKDYEVSVTEAPPALDYCVQYRETDLRFVSRLLEEAGIFYYFRHEEDKHVMVLGDATTAYRDCVDGSLDYQPGSHHGPHLWELKHGWSFISGKFAQRDYNFESPSTDLTAEAETIVQLPGTEKYEIYDYPGDYSTGDHGIHLSRRRMEQEEAAYERIEAEGYCAGFYPAGRFTLNSRELEQEDGKQYVLTEARYAAFEPSLAGVGGDELRGRAEDDDRPYRVSMRCIPADVVFRPTRVTPRPLVHGPQTAVVVGPSGEEVYSDEHGRIKVQFHWDREGKKDAASSCWIRVAQSWAGKRWGAHFLPRIGQEVVVEFLEGDPRRPIIVGSLYNGEQPPPYDTTEAKSITGFRTRSTKGGDAEDFNELCFDDKKGAELFYLHAQRDEQHEVENDQRLEVGNDQGLKVGNDQRSEIGNDRVLEVGNDRQETISNHDSLAVGGNRKATVGGDSSEVIEGSSTVSVDKSQSITVGANRAEDISGTQSLSVGKDASTDVTGKMTFTIAKDLSITVSADQKNEVAKTLKTQAKAIHFTATDEITIRTGDASIVLKKDGDITIQGKKITVKGSADVIIKGSKSTIN